MSSTNRKYAILMRAIISIALVCSVSFVTDVSAAPTALEDDIARTTIDQLKSMMAKKQGVVIIDARSSGYDKKIKGALSIPLDQTESQLKKIPRNRPVVIYCACGNEETAVAAAKILLEHGFKRVSALKGGWNGWVDSGGAVEST